MAKKKSEIKKKLHHATKLSIILICLIVLLIISILSLANAAGSLGLFLSKAMHLVLGKGAFLFPIILSLTTIAIIKNFKARKIPLSTLIGLSLLITSLFGIMHLISPDIKQSAEQTFPAWGGYLGLAASFFILKFSGFWVSLITFFAMFLIALLVTFNIPLLKFRKQEVEEEDRDEEEPAFASLREATAGKQEIPIPIFEEKQSKLSRLVKSIVPKFRIQQIQEPVVGDSVTQNQADSIQQAASGVTPEINSSYQLPSLDLLESDKGKPTSGNIEMNQQTIERTFKNFNIEVEMGNVEVGPTVTQYTLRPASGIKLSKITSLQNDLSMALAAHPIRIEAPIPGQSLVGIEIPNKKNKLVRLKDLLESNEFVDKKASSGSLGLIALGRDVSGKPKFADLTKMPHLLVAGSTGSGKTVCLNTIILSLLFQNSPDELQFIFIDPKRVELIAYNNIPHLISPVIVEHKKAINALKWAVSEMERRFKILQNAGVRDVATFNLANNDPLPYIVIMVDELADLMVAHGRDIEAGVVRLAQMARAIGIHLIVSTQRPSVEVITGLIKANITSRIAFQVATQIDSRTILDMAGAEKLLGNGDMLFLSGEAAKPRRIQGALVNDKEIKKIAAHWAGQGGSENQEIVASDKDSEDAVAVSGMQTDTGDSKQGSADFDLNKPAQERALNNNPLQDKKIPSDELYDEAKQVVIESKRASASLLQRRLRIGYARAARLLDLLEQNGIVGPAQGSKPREVLIG